MKARHYLLLVGLLLLGSTSASAQCGGYFDYTGNANTGEFNFFDSLGQTYTSDYWDFGDGTTSKNSSNASALKHKYKKPGIYYVCRIVENSAIPCKDSFCVKVVYDTNQCNAEFQSANRGKKTNFSHASQIGLAKNRTVRWDFGDNKGKSGNHTPSYTYDKYGTYTVCATVTTFVNNVSCSDTACQTVKVDSCYTYFTKKINRQEAELKAYNPAGSRKDFAWYIYDSNGNLEKVTPDVSEIKHKFKAVGTYRVVLQVFDSLSTCFSEFSDSIRIDSIDCSRKYAKFWVKNYGAGEVKLSPLNSHAKQVSFTWDFGDGNTGTSSYASHPTHFYDTLKLPATFKVCLTAYDSTEGCAETRCKPISVIKGTCSTTFGSSIKVNHGTFTPSTSNHKGKQYVWRILKESEKYPTWKITNGPLKHRFSSKGSYHIYLEAYDSTQNCTSRFSDTITIDSMDCNTKADFSIKVKGYTAELKVESRKEHEAWKWSYLNKTVFRYNLSDTIEVVEFPGPGKYKVLLEVMDSSQHGCSDTISKTVVISKPCTAAFRVAIDTSKKFKLFLVNESTDKTSHTYEWTFGDGKSSKKRNPKHKYAKSGKYEVCLTVKDAVDNCTDTYCDSLGLDSLGRLLKAGGFELIVIENDLVGIAAVEALDYSLYPNPSNGKITLELKQQPLTTGFYRIYTIHGTLVSDEQLNRAAKTTIDLTHLPDGLYTLQVFDGRNHRNAKFIKRSNN
ncbi:MAG: PKD domain-containing protein [Bacteroidia bacterium]|nr:PKD domain-containing protein [Bacteroidia bacterium]